MDDSLLGNGGFDDPRDGFEATGCCELRLSIVVLLVGLFGVLAEKLEEELGQVLDEIQREGGDFVGKVLDDAFEGVDDILEVVVLKKL